MHNVQEGLGIKNISDLVRKEIQIHGVFGNKNPIINQIRKYERSGKERFSDYIYTYVRSDLVLNIIKNCRE